MIYNGAPLHFHRISKPNSLFHGGSVLAIGNLEGVHLGHMALLKTAHALADAGGHAASVLTFTPHPREYFKPELKPLKLMRLAAKIQALRNQGIDDVIMLHFNAEIAAMHAREFITEFCIKTLKARHIVTGANFYFGKNREGNASMLSETMQSLGLGYSCVEPVVSEDGQVISSSRIRSLLAAGKFQEASALLGRPYTLSGRVVHGAKRGRVLGFKTANIWLKDIFLPSFGVYAVRISMGHERYFGIANLGTRPSFSGEGVNLEVHIFDFDKDIYGARIAVQPVQFIRPEQRFDSQEMMIDQLGKDVLKAKHILQTHLHT